ncbi:MAG: TIGR01777 family oxidoreductase [Caldilineaceae bacterium]
MRIIVTGGTGLIGKVLCRALLADGHLVTVLSRNPDQARGLLRGLRVEKWDAQSTTGLPAIINGADAVVNLAGAGIADAPWTEKRKHVIRESRIRVGLVLDEVIQEVAQKPKIFIQASAVGYYGVHNDDELITETTPAGSDFLAKVCFDWEMSTSMLSKKLGIRRPILRTGIVLSNDGGAFPKITLPFKFFAGGPLGNGKQWMPWIHIEDEVRAIQFLLENEKADGPFNLCAPNPVTNKEFSEIVGATMRRPAFLPAPAFALKTVLGKMSTILLDGQRAVPAKLEALGFSFKHPTAREAIAALLL